ncbi:hypothetical protein PK98_15370 [Croceibacterium mercuriale]|uniref:DUF4142 domain-containing protein n=1 Tax=Croceibacterium mercuriale TaxID=1572751 RepID=A0A0B2BW13_9SPHN|nr:hypothetical protein [Croceibacterium mercuriale]KHL24149.1 hypothetical protein PK98_15370 [Croceibacterium mercuriale]
MKKFASVIVAAAVLVTATAPVPAAAQFGGLARRVLGGGAAAGVSNADGEAFLTDAARSTKNIMISALVLSQMLENHGDLAGARIKIEQLQGAQTVGELDAHKATLASSLEVLNSREDVGAELTAAYEAGNDQQKQLMAVALGNLAIGVARNVMLAERAPGMVEGIGGNPQLLTRIGQFRSAASLLGMQATGLGKIGGALPGLLRTVKVELPADAATSEPQPIVL